MPLRESSKGTYIIKMNYPEEKLHEYMQRLLLQYLKDVKVDLEKRGYIATLEKAIEELEENV